jgi:hypothetical protein
LIFNREDLNKKEEEERKDIVMKDEEEHLKVEEKGYRGRRRGNCKEER